jgi:hypothetical protein
VLTEPAGLKAAPVFTNEIFPVLWDAGTKYDIDPVGLDAQSYKETGAGKFGGKVTPQFYNTAGIKIRDPGMFPGVTDDDHPLAHQLFPNWDTGAVAQAQHVLAYAGQ